MAQLASPPLARGLSETPPMQQMSKKDKKRNLIHDRFSEIINSFSRDRDQHYRAQLQAIQVDMNLIMRANPYGDTPLDETGDDVAEQVNSVLGGSSPSVPSAQGDYAAMVGRRYSKFVEEVNNAMEERDAQLTRIYNNYRNRVYELERNNRFKVRVAQEEHRILASTVRDRLIQTISQKRQRLMREKDQLDISDSNALLLHPNQFTIANPASPGGLQSNRKTRHMRHLARDQDEMQPATSAQESHKRKHKALVEEENGSPGPSSRTAEPVAPSPYRDAKAKAIYSQYEASAYSIDRLFTEKELALCNQTAGIAANQFFARLRTQMVPGKASAANGGNGVIADADSSTNAKANERDAEDDARLVAPDMDRAGNTSSHNHVTRSTRNNAASALTDLANIAVGERPFPPSGPAFAVAPVISLNSKDKAFAPAPPPIPTMDADNDLRWMTRPLEEGNAETVQQYEELLDNVCSSRDETMMLGMPFRADSAAATMGMLKGMAEVSGASVLAGAVQNRSSVGATGGSLSVPQVEVGGVSMSAQSSRSGVNGSVVDAVNGKGTSMDGASMKRTGSGFALTSADEGMRRTRSRIG